MDDPTQVPEDCRRAFRLERELARGGFGVVWLATQRGLDRPVAIKVLHNIDPSQRERFVAEARLTASLSDPHVVKVLSHGDEDVPWIAYEYLPGRSLRDRLTAGPIEVAAALDIADQIAAALQAAHAVDIIHRDIKPENVLEAERDLYKVTDFGIAKWTAGPGLMTETGVILGTPTYLAPELVEGAPPSARTDLYALGVVLYEMLGGQPPYEGDGPHDILRKHLAGRATRLAKLVPDLPPDVAALAMSTMARAPADRSDSAAAFRQRLAHARAPGAKALGRTVSGKVPRLRPTRVQSTLVAAAPAPASRPGRRALPLGAGVALALLAALGASLRNPPDPVPTAVSPAVPVTPSPSPVPGISAAALMARHPGIRTSWAKWYAGIIQKKRDVGKLKYAADHEASKPHLMRCIDEAAEMLAEATHLSIRGPDWFELWPALFLSLEAVVELDQSQRPSFHDAYRRLRTAANHLPDDDAGARALKTLILVLIRANLDQQLSQVDISLAYWRAQSELAKLRATDRNGEIRRQVTVFELIETALHASDRLDGGPARFLMKPEPQSALFRHGAALSRLVRERPRSETPPEAREAMRYVVELASRIADSPLAAPLSKEKRDQITEFWLVCTAFEEARKRIAKSEESLLELGMKRPDPSAWK